jgi:hypothetical protein
MDSVRVHARVRRRRASSSGVARRFGRVSFARSASSRGVRVKKDFIRRKRSYYSPPEREKRARRLRPGGGRGRGRRRDATTAERRAIIVARASGDHRERSLFRAFVDSFASPPSALDRVDRRGSACRRSPGGCGSAA